MGEGFATEKLRMEVPRVPDRFSFLVLAGGAPEAGQRGGPERHRARCGAEHVAKSPNSLDSDAGCCRAALSPGSAEGGRRAVVAVVADFVEGGLCHREPGQPTSAGESRQCSAGAQLCPVASEVCVTKVSCAQAHVISEIF